MNAAPDIVAQVHAAGGRIMMVADRLKVRAPLPLPNELVAQVRRHKVDIMTLLQDRKTAWTPEGWRTFYGERAAVAEHDGGRPPAEAEARAYKCCIVAWLNHNPPPENGAERCVQCNKPMTGTEALPFLTGAGGHIWMHDHCHAPWMKHRRAEAAGALRRMGIAPPSS